MSNNIDRKEFGKRCADVRKKIGLTQNELAKELGLTQNTLSKIERGENVMSETLIKIISYYSQYVSIDIMLSKNYKNRYSLLNKQITLNNIIKMKLDVIKEDIIKNNNGIISKIEESIDLL
ncbi:MAG: helix-turn-helix transcriptional regulator [Prevotella sp.]|nr:helix-turn-helix transcriptional regulator [Prevotella sp.]